MQKLKSGIFSGVKGVVIALLFSLVSVLLFALAIDIFNLPLTIIKPINCILKILAVIIGSLFVINGEKGLIKGAALGGVISFLSFLLFGSIGGEISYSLNLLWEVLLGATIGGIAGVVAVAIKR